MFRYVSRGGTSTGLDGGYGYGCGGEVWLNSRHFGLEDRVISVEGDAQPVPTEEAPRFHLPSDFGVEVGRTAGFDWVTFPGGYRQFLDDGRFVFQTNGISARTGDALRR